jgi:hypothetical protein
MLAAKHAAVPFCHCDPLSTVKLRVHLLDRLRREGGAPFSDAMERTCYVLCDNGLRGEKKRSLHSLSSSEYVGWQHLPVPILEAGCPSCIAKCSTVRRSGCREQSLESSSTSRRFRQTIAPTSEQARHSLTPPLNGYTQ